jgi:protein involved in polysaccharide export with SLBB domain
MARQFVYLVGQVVSPGAYEMKTGWTVVEAVAQAGGVTPKAALRKASLIRRGTNVTIPLDLERIVLRGDQAANVLLQGGDVILVPEFLNRVLVWGIVRNPGAFDLNEGARVLDAILAAGGPIVKAATDAVSVVRQTPDGKRVVAATVNVDKILKGDAAQNILLQHADIVFVPQSNRLTWQDILSYLGGIGIITSLFGF